MLRRFFLFLAIFSVTLAAGYWMVQPAPSSKTTEFELPFAANAQSSNGSDTKTSIPVITEMVLGSENAPITVIEYASFTCPHCASFHQDVYKPLKKNYIDTNKVKFVFREVYFDRRGMWASLLARCAGRDKFFLLTKELLASQNKWSRADVDDLTTVNELEKIGLKIGMDKSQVGSCLQNGDKLRALVDWYKENVKRDKIQSTPSFIIDGEFHSTMSYEEFSKLLDKKLDL